MSSVQRRHTSSSTSHPSSHITSSPPTTTPPPPITTSADLCNALSLVQKDALASGLSESEFADCLATTAKQKLNINLGRKAPTKVSTAFTCCRFGLRVLWVSFLLLVAFLLLMAYCKPVSFYMQKTFHTKLYHVARPMRLGVLALLPYLIPLGLNPLRECIIENPLLNDTECCACYHVTKATELKLSDPVLPGYVLETPQHNVYVVRRAMQFDPPFSLDMLQDFHKSSGGNPHICMEIGHENPDGLIFYRQLFDRREVEQAMQSQDPWTFTWEECPTFSDPLTFRSLLPPSSPLPLHTSTNTLFTLSTQWAMEMHHQGILRTPLVGVVVLYGEVRFVVDPLGEKCQSYCSDHTPSHVLSAGDMLVFDQRLWLHQSYTWSNVSLTMSVGLGVDTT